MSQLLINDYLKQLDVIKRVSGSQRETIVREAFKDLPKSDPAAGSNSAATRSSRLRCCWRSSADITGLNPSP